MNIINRTLKQACSPSQPKRSFTRAVTGIAAVFAIAGCGVISGGDEEPAAETELVESTGSAEQLCATAAEFAGPLTTAADVGQLADAKIGYLQAARTTAPAEWVDNIDIILPAWEFLVEIIEAADGDPSLIDFDKFLTDFADATANDAALESFVQSRCATS